MQFWRISNLSSSCYNCKSIVTTCTPTLAAIDFMIEQLVVERVQLYLSLAVLISEVKRSIVTEVQLDSITVIICAVTHAAQGQVVQLIFISQLLESIGTDNIFGLRLGV